MRARLLGLVAAAAALALALAPMTPSAAASATPLFDITAAQLDEVSGIAAGITSPGVVYVHNDSGDSARFFALDASSGAVLAEYDLAGVDAVDWEDIAVAPDADGTPSVWLADIGDNGEARRDVVLYRVDEPTVDTSARDARITITGAEVWRLRYPGGAMDAESLAVSPDGVPYLVTKSWDGRSQVLRVPLTSVGDDVRTLEPVGTTHFTFTGTPGPYAPLGELTATGADLSPDGDLFVVRTYTDAYFWRVRDGDVGAAITRAPTRIALPRQPQGEGICFDGEEHVLIDSEKTGSAVYRLAVPSIAALPAPTSTPPSASSSGPPPPSSPATAYSTSPVADTESTMHQHAGTYVLGLIAGLAVIAVLGGLVLARRRRA